MNEINRLWDDTLIDGNVASVVSYSPSQICVEIVPYRALHAGRRNPDLLQLHPMGVSGRILYRDAVLVGRRAKRMSLFPGAFECCPSGHVDTQFLKDKKIDILELITQELVEETGIHRDSVHSIVPQHCCYSLKDGTWDLHCDILLSVAPKRLQPTEEYDQFCWLTSKEVPQFLLQENVVPLTEWLLRLP
jgi:isopentenyldiphosphate isomerase